MENEARIFYVVLIFVWGIFVLGLAIALPFMIKDGFFEPQISEPHTSTESRRYNFAYVIPAKAGIERLTWDSCFRRNDIHKSSLTGLNIFASIAAPLYAATKDEVIIEQEYHETIYSLKDTPIKLSVYHGGNEGVVHFESRSDKPIDWQVAIMGRLLSRFLKDQKGPIDTLFMGTLEESFGSNKEVSRRLVVAAKASPSWDARKGKAKNGNDNQTVARLLNDNNVYRE